MVFISVFVLLGGSFEALALLQQPTGGYQGRAGRRLPFHLPSAGLGTVRVFVSPWGALQPLQGPGQAVVGQGVLDRPSRASPALSLPLTAAGPGQGCAVLCFPWMLTAAAGNSLQGWFQRTQTRSRLWVLLCSSPGSAGCVSSRRLWLSISCGSVLLLGWSGCSSIPVLLHPCGKLGFVCSDGGGAQFMLPVITALGIIPLRGMTARSLLWG